MHITRGSGHAPLPAEVRDELLLATCIVPLLYTDMRLPVDPYPVATDASLDGGAVTVATGLTSAGVRAAHNELRIPRGLNERGLIVVELFGGIGGLHMSLDRLGQH
eukprot:9793255-Heterocapsa_arctica.AAC.1